MEMEKRLYEAALEGNVLTLKALIKEDPLTLDRISLTFFHETPLHVSILREHHEFARAVLSHNPRLTTELDSLGHTPLHVAAAKGHVEIVRELLRVGPSACLAFSKDGKIPLHLAVMKGDRDRVEVVSELARACPESTRSRLDRGGSVYHLCVKYNNLEALQVLVEELVGENENLSDLLNSRDDDGNTLFHLAALYKHLEIIKYLLTKPSIEQNAVNNNGLTALDLIENSPRDLKTLEILNLLIKLNFQRASNDHGHDHSSHGTKKASTSIVTQRGNSTQPRPRSRTKSWKDFFTFSNSNQLEDIRGELFIVATIIVAITALPIINMKVNPNGPDLTDAYPIITLSLVPALSMMVLLVSGLPLRNKVCAWLVIQLMYTSLGFLGLSYLGEIISNESRYSNVTVTFILMCIWFGLLIVATLLNMIRLIVWLVKSIKGCVKKRRLRSRKENVMLNA